MSEWPSAKARSVLGALFRIGWRVKREAGGSHRVLAREGWPDFVFAFREGEEIGPRMLARIARHTGLRPEDLSYRQTFCPVLICVFPPYREAGLSVFCSVDVDPLGQGSFPAACLCLVLRPGTGSLITRSSDRGSLHSPKTDSLQWYPASPTRRHPTYCPSISSAVSASARGKCLGPYPSSPLRSQRIHQRAG